MEQERRDLSPQGDVDNVYSWLAVGVAVGSVVGVATGEIALGVGAGFALGALGAILSKRGKPDEDGES